MLDNLGSLTGRRRPSKGILHIILQDLKVQCTLQQDRDLHSQPHHGQLNPPPETAWIFGQHSKCGSCRSAKRQATADIAQQSKLHTLELFGIGNKAATWHVTLITLNMSSQTSQP